MAISNGISVSNATIVTNISSTTERNLITSLPVVNQTVTLQRFFGSTVDQVFQPGAFQPINGYVGQRPNYYNSVTDFYLAEPDYPRELYQLEPGMVSSNTSGSFVYSLTYPDLIGYFSAQGANVSNHSRMFETNDYSWSPPIDIDKLVNFNNYYWFGDYDSFELPVLTLTSPTISYYGDGSTVTFALPVNVSNAQTSTAAYVNSVKVSNIVVSANTVTLPLAPLTNDVVVLTWYDDLTIAIQNTVTFALNGFVSNAILANASVLTSGMLLNLQDTSRIFNGFDNISPYDQYFDERYLSNGSVLDQATFDTVTSETFFVDGVGQSIRLTPTSSMDQELAPQYYTIDRSSLDKNPWSLCNNWVHKDSFAWSGQTFGTVDSVGRPLRAQRPIIEFIRDIQLFDYGYHRILPIDGVLSTSNATQYGNTPIPFSQIAGAYVGSVTVDNGVVVFPGMRLLVAQPGFAATAPNQQLYLVGTTSATGMYDDFPWEDAPWSVPTVTELTLTPITQNAGDVAVVSKASGYGAAGTEMYFNGTVWNKAQSWGENVETLFALYDLSGVELNNPNTYRNSTFAGSRIFGYATGSGTNDPVLHRPLDYDNNGYIVFENDVVTRPAYTVLNGNETLISGLYCYTTQSVDFAPISLWHPIADHTTQDVLTTSFDGTSYFSIPMNLQVNPTSADVQTISASDWQTHFQDEIQNQVGFTGNPFAANNWRDTLRDLSLGDQILQHVAPLLKVMLLSDETKFDYLATLRYIDLQYNLFRNQFSRKLLEFDTKATLLPAAATTVAGVSTSYGDWVTAVLNNLKVNRNASFPFFLSTMGGGTYFIPATPAFLGVLPSYVPSIFVDNTYPIPVTMIRGHDGSLTPAFGDWRDNVILALETNIYNSIPTHYVDLARPLFDLEYYTAGRFCPAATGAFTSDNAYVGVSYTRGEVQAMLAPIFERWTQLSRIDYRTNAIYDANNPFTWNYRGMPDRYGDLVPGNWRAIYRWYFDTDRPHTNPWEMLGFVNRPSWWVGQYGAAPYTSTNTQLWADLEAGLIRQGTRAGVNLRYSRSGLSNVIPVDTAGNLLDPITCGIVPINTVLTSNSSATISNVGVTPPMSAHTLSYGGRPIAEMASRPWASGDGGPAETMWINSPSYRYALAQIAFMTKPARLVEMTWDSINYGFFNGQWIDYRTNQRPQNAGNYVHGELGADGVTLTTVYGIQQWISDYIVSSAQSPSLLGNAVRGLDVRLIHRMASFVSSSELNVVADNFGVLPTEDVNVFLYETPSSDTEVYSGVIVEWMGNGWRVIGYDTRNPVFSVIPPDTFGPKGVITLATSVEAVINNWVPNTYYRLDQLVTYQGVTYSALVAHVSGQRFEQSYWKVSSATYPQAPRVIKYLNGITPPQVQSIPYGTEFYSLQQVADFLLSYERYLVSRGWTFTVQSKDGTVRDWTNAVKEFLTWSQVDWAVGNFIALSPGAEELHFYTANGTILNVEDSNTGFFGLLDRSGNPIGNRQALISRLDGDLTLVAKDADIFAARVRIVEIEHALIFNNITIFNDVVYQPLFNVRQPRLKVLGNMTTNWTGRLDAPGFIIEGNEVVPNFDRNVEDIRLMFDIEQSLRSDFTEFARHNIGYQARDYMETLVLAEVEQFEFYQGMIQQKGTPDVFNKLLRSSRISGGSNIQFLEEFAIRTSRFGGPLQPRITFLLNQLTVKNNPQFIMLGNYPTYPTVDPTWIIMSPDDPRWIDAPAVQGVSNTNQTWDNFAWGNLGWDVAKPTGSAVMPFFPLQAPVDPNNLQPNPIPSAGPVRQSDVDYQVFYFYYLAAIYTAANAVGTVFTTGERAWIYEDSPSLSWNVYEVFELGNQPNYISYTTTTKEDSSVQGVRIYFSEAHGLTQNNVGQSIIVDGKAYCTPEIQGIQTIEVVNTVANWIEIDVAGTQGFNFANATTQAPPNVRIFNSVRFPTLDALIASPLIFQLGDIAWIDNDRDFNGLWTVRQNNGAPWTQIRIQPPRLDPNAIIESMIYDISTEINNVAKTITSNNPILNDLTIIDPLAGKLPGAAMEEIDFQMAYDPAKYSSSLVYNISSDAWGQAQVGRVWWDLSAVRFLEPYTDQTGITPERDLAEIDYRVSVWATIAPNTAINVYEWIQSPVPPTEYTSGTYAGTVYNADTPSYATQKIWDATYNKDITYYYFWVTGLTTVPNVSTRKISITDVANILESPTGQDIPWFAPILPEAMIISGVQPYLNDTSTVLKVQTSHNANDQGHAQWMLMRPNDETSLPPDWLWRAMVDSLAGFDAGMDLLPNPGISPYRAVGIYPGQNMFEVDQTNPGDRLGLLAARESFIGIINSILATTPVVIDRPLSIASLARQTPISATLFWSRIDDSYVIEPPPVNEWDYVVYSIEERNRLVLRPDFQAAITNTTTLRVLIDGTMQATPQWSIWWFNPSVAAAVLTQNNTLVTPLPIIDALYNNTNTIFTLAPSYDVSVTTLAQRNALTGLTVGTRVYVSNDDANLGFWVIYLYDPTNSVADSAGFIIHRVQSYRTSDFYSIVDWYNQAFDTGLQTIAFSANNPPQVTYASAAAASAAEGSNPNNVFVAISNGGAWFWQYFANGVWTVVAQQGATVQLSANFYNASLDIHAVNSIETNTIANRDGSWEIKVLADSIRRSGLLLDSELNTVFFSMLHFVHSQQDDVDWAFKTSFMVIAGYAIPLLQTGILTEDISNALISYVDEVKPYHVKIRDYKAQYTPPIDVANVHPEEILRDFKITLAFDRVTDYNLDKTWDGIGWDGIGWDKNETGLNTAIDRVMTDYNPLPGMPPVSSALINTLYRYPSVNLNGNLLGNAAYDVDYQGLIANTGNIALTINPNDITSGYDAAYGRFDSSRVASNTFVDLNRPEERVSTLTDDGLVMTIHAHGTPGMPGQKVRAFKTDGQLQTLKIGQLPQSFDGLMVYFDGVHGAEGTDYIADYFNQSIDLITAANVVSIHTFGFGGEAGILERRMLSYTGTPLLPTNDFIANNIQVVVDGLISNFTLANGITISASAGADVAVIVWDNAATDACLVQTQSITLTSNTASYALLYPDNETIPAHAGTIVEVNGLRLAPPPTYYGSLTDTSRMIIIDGEISPNAMIDVYLDGVFYANVFVPLSEGISTTPTGYPLDIIAASYDGMPWDSYPYDEFPMFVRYDRYLVAVNSVQMVDSVVVVIHQPDLMQYQVIDNAVVFTDNSVLSHNTALVTTFSNANMMGIKTHSFWSHQDGGYICENPYNLQSSLVSFNGHTLVPDLDYNFTTSYANTITHQIPINVLTIPLDPGVDHYANAVGSARVVATIFTGEPARLPMTWKSATTSPAAARMEPASTNGFDSDPFDIFSPFDTPLVWAFDYPRYPANGNTNPVQIYTMGAWEYTSETIFNTGVLATELLDNATTIVVTPNFGNLSPRIWPIQLSNTIVANTWTWEGNVFTPPDPVNNRPGVVWVGGERIEFMAMAYDPPSYGSQPATLTPPNVVLSNLRRATQGTSLQTENRVANVAACDGSNTLFSVPATGALDIQIILGNAVSADWTGFIQNTQTLSNVVNSTFVANTVDHYWANAGTDFTVVSNGVTTVTMTVAPPAGAFVAMGVTIDASHKAGTRVADGAFVFSIERGSEIRDFFAGVPEPIPLMIFDDNRRFGFGRFG